MKRASIDIGSNSVLLLIADINGEDISELANESRVTSLGRNLDKTGCFAKESMDDTFVALSEYSELIKNFEIEPQNIKVTATEASRVAKNAPEFYSKVLKETGLNVSIINAKGEAYYTAKGICADSELINSNEFCILDIGGASTELIIGPKSPFHIDQTISLPIGSVRASDWKMEKTLEQNFNSAIEKYDLSPYKGRNIIGVAGTVTTLVAIFLDLKEFSADRVHGSSISRESLESFLDQYQEINGSQLLEKWPFIGKRSKTIIGGALVLKRIFDELSLDTLVVSTFGLRYGTLLESGINKDFLIE